MELRRAVGILRRLRIRSDRRGVGWWERSSIAPVPLRLGRGWRRRYVRRPGCHRCRTRQRLKTLLPLRFIDEARELRTVLIRPVGRRVLRVRPCGVVDAPRRDQHAHEVRGDAGMSGRQTERRGVVLRGRVVVRVERGGDRESVGDPGRERRVLSRLQRAAEVSRGGPGPALHERRAACAHQRLRQYRRCLGRPLRGLHEVLLGGDEVLIPECDVAESEQWLRCVVVVLGERDVESLGDVDLSGGERGGGDREAVLQHFPGVRPIVRRRPVGARGEKRECNGRHRHTRAERGRRSSCDRSAFHFLRRMSPSTRRLHLRRPHRGVTDDP